MSCVIDHLQRDHRVRVLQDFADAHGVRHCRGETAVIRKMDLDWARQEFVIEWERDAVMEKLVFLLAAKEGPRSGGMREFFAMEERVPRPEDTRRGRMLRDLPPVPELAAEVIVDSTHYDEAVLQVWALAARRQFAEADRLLHEILSLPDPHGGRLQQLAGYMVGMTAAHVTDADGAVYTWLRERAIRYWYAWGSGATSGGEGAACAVHIRAAEARLAECDALRP